MIKGKVTSVKALGLFVDMGQGVQGLVRMSDLPDIDCLADSGSLPGSTLLVQVLGIDADKHQIDLALVSDVPVPKRQPAWDKE